MRKAYSKGNHKQSIGDKKKDSPTHEPPEWGRTPSEHPSTPHRWITPSTFDTPPLLSIVKIGHPVPPVSLVPAPLTRNSLSIFPDLRPWMRAVWSMEEDNSWEPSRANTREVTPWVCALSNRRRHCPVETFQTFILPSWRQTSRPGFQVSKVERSEMRSCEERWKQKYRQRQERNRSRDTNRNKRRGEKKGKSDRIRKQNKRNEIREEKGEKR